MQPPPNDPSTATPAALRALGDVLELQGHSQERFGLLLDALRWLAAEEPPRALVERLGNLPEACPSGAAPSVVLARWWDGLLTWGAGQVCQPIELAPAFVTRSGATVAAWRFQLGPLHIDITSESSDALAEITARLSGASHPPVGIGVRLKGERESFDLSRTESASVFRGRVPSGKYELQLTRPSEAISLNAYITIS